MAARRARAASARSAASSECEAGPASTCALRDPGSGCGAAGFGREPRGGEYGGRRPEGVAAAQRKASRRVARGRAAGCSAERERERDLAKVRTQWSTASFLCVVPQANQEQAEGVRIRPPVPTSSWILASSG
ncbi:unnamed protein product [Urochloa humidicola]